MSRDSQSEPDSATAGVIARPPLLFLGCLALGLILDRVSPFAFPVAAPAAGAAGGILIVVGIAVFAAGIRGFLRAATPVPTSEPVRALVTTGIHGRSRNPIYLGMFLVYAGVGIAASSVWTLALLLPLAVVIRFGVVAREEAYLERRFGEHYRDYKTRVRRWL